MVCGLCNTERDADKVEETAGSYICGSCVQLLLNTPQERLQKAYALAVERGYLDKTRAIQSFLMEVSTYDKEAKDAKRSMERKRYSRTVRLARYRVRTQSSTF